MTLLIRYLMLCYASASAWAQYSTDMTDRSCTADSAVYVIAVLGINTCSIVAMAWRSHAVARGVIERPAVRRGMQAVLLFMMVSRTESCSSDDESLSELVSSSRPSPSCGGP